ncbi:hypothetical protein QBC46DRAFT_154153 [Diplogelasinospora grovesii]|uniref:Nitrogen regulatory protein areA GATA-like domain-containing protein n=1 Tax=Diplogelasinospora grovesii TaxID=303347 RepID=A0AAN6N829_9PEZI|nr:hypothetical protein QBC46DRAFT_154153 [Diplogelasinospora grovesii]
MPLSLDAHVLQVDTNVIHKVDTTNPQNLFSMWTVFTKCKDSVAEGRRLENLSWRLWNRETFCCESGEIIVETHSASQPKDIQASRDSITDDVPQLSGSVDSVADEEAVDFTTESAPVDILRPRIRRQDSCASSRSRGRERHITSDDLSKMVVTIIESKIPLNAPLPDIPALSPPTEADQPEKTSTSPESEPERSGSTTSESSPSTSSSENNSMESLQAAPAAQSASNAPPTIVTRGFSPSQVPITRITSQSAADPSPSAIPMPTDAPAPMIVPPKGRQPMFKLGGSSGSGDESFSDRDRSLDTRKQPVPQPKMPQQKRMFQVGGSSEEENSLKSALHTSKGAGLLNGQKKTASFSNQVVTRTFPSAVSDNEQSDTDYIDESAIDDDDDSSEWEDSVEDSGRSSMDEKINFKRVDSKANLTSRPSLITLMLAQNSRAQKPNNIASQSTTALPRARTSLNGPSMVASPNDSDEAPLMMKKAPRAPPMRPINEIPRSTAQPIVTTSNGIHHQAALSPRTTRRNMLATELTESLRRQLLWERSQKSKTANAVLQRRHTSQDIANLKQYPQRPFMKKEPESNSNNPNSSSWKEYFTEYPLAGYHDEVW